MDPALMHHRSGVNKMVIPAETAEIKRGMREFIDKSLKDPSLARNCVIRFIGKEKSRIEEGLIAPATLYNQLKPIRIALELNEVPFAWKKIMRLLPKSVVQNKDREYYIEEIRRLANVASLKMKVAIMIMMSCGMRIGGFDYLKVGDIQPLEKDGEILCGKITVYSGESEDEYESLISKEAYLTFKEYLQVRRDQGEIITDDSPALFTRGQGSTGFCKSGTVRNGMLDLLWNSGLRTEKKKRYY